MIVLCLLLAFLPAGPVFGIDIGQDGSLRIATSGFREWLKKNSDVKRFHGERVHDRDRTPFQPDGIRLGTYLVFPSIGADVVYDDNIYATRDNRVSDFRSEITPTIRLQSGFPRHVLDITAGTRIVKYLNHRELDFIDSFARVDSALHFDHAHTLSFSAVTSYLHEDRASPLAPTTAREPAGYWFNKASLALTRDAGRLYGTVLMSAEMRDYQNLKALNGSTILQDKLDSRLYIGQLRMGYRFSPGFELIGKLKLLRHENSDVALTNLDGWGYEGVAGLAFQTSPLLRFMLVGGYGHRDYDDDLVKDLNTFLLEGKVEWLPTMQLTVSARLRREIGDLTATDGGSRINTLFELTAKYEIWRNLMLDISGSVLDSTYSLDGRHDLTYDASIGLDYLHTKNWAFNISYDYLNRSSNIDEFDLRRNRIRVGAKLRF